MIFFLLQAMKYFFEEIKREVNQIQSEWHQEVSRLGKDLRLDFPWEISPMHVQSFDIHNVELSSMYFLENHIKSLEVASSSYHKVLEENRFLYNQVQDLKGNSRIQHFFKVLLTWFFVC